MERKAGFLQLCSLGAECVNAMCEEGGLPCMRVETDVINEMTGMCWGKKGEMWYFGKKRRKKWTILGLGVEKHKVVCLCDERN